MFCPAIFSEDRVEVMHALIRRHPLATLITAGANGLKANLLPFILAAGGEKGILRAHLAKVNDQLNDLRDAAETLVVFHGPQTYITPSWYPSKAEHGKVVPTWNYVVVQARGIPRIIEDTDWLRAQIGDLTASQENSRRTPWQVSDAPPDFIDAQLRGIAGIEIPIQQLQGKWKVSQNRPDADRAGVVAGLSQDGNDDAMASLVRNRGAGA